MTNIHIITFNDDVLRRVTYCSLDKNNCPYYEIDNGYGYCTLHCEDLACYHDETAGALNE